MSRQNPIKQEARKIKYDYLKTQGSKGGKPYGFIVHAEEWLKNNEEWVTKNAKELFLQVCQKTWGEKLSKASPEQIDLILDGNPLPLELKYRDDMIDPIAVENQIDTDNEDPSSYTTVLTAYASLRQFRLAWMEVQDNANNQVKVATQMLEQWKAMFKLAKGDESRRIADLLVLEPEPAQT